MGSAATSNPPALPATSYRMYPGAGMRLGENILPQFDGSFSSVSLGDMRSNTMTALAPQTAALGFTVYGAAFSPRDHYLLFSACDASNACGIYETKIDNSGVFVPNSLTKLANSPAATNVENMAAIRHPVTGSTILYANRGTVDVWEQPAAGGPITLLKQVQAPSNTHFRVESDNDKVVLHYLVRTGSGAGTYTLPITAVNGKHVVGTVRKVSAQAAGTELIWLPAVNKWAVYYRDKTASGAMTRCWIEP